MILITGGLGFIGLQTARALLAMGETCVLTQHSLKRIPEALKGEIGSRLFIEELDMLDAAAFLKLGEKYPITGIIHLAVHWRNPGTHVLELFENIKFNMIGLVNALEAAQAWKVKRILVASSLNVYGDERTVPWREEQPLPLTGPEPVSAIKKSNEIVADYLARQTGIECIMLRFGEIFGPFSPWDSPTNVLVHAAVNGTKPDFSNVLGGVSAQDGADRCYVKDAARAIALLQVAETLPHRVYNIASGRATTNQDIVTAIKEVIPEAQVELPSAGERSAAEVPAYQDITRLVQDTGYRPQFTTTQAIVDYIACLRASNE
ncbi:NAD(P)-dependent oxidoreductase [Ktedonosporobacter rubrisoli]|uniref:NAD(P)-dependent oxidoreductase n=1 Tax=Ktedonosporobacter rubrisoli TaxID=2509675 RepID=A0A4P6JVM6_KTERU|nr:NAD(P)-dependent oxidoreductase [Ktedonosporobacter rubrisoli]QBD79594.1 NAD(P)-dependent oxidoreductase [Ktedonosporobacter rubrisoli]